jgi:NADH dehydrogenase (ubiquinone) Fe-S protein 1
MKRIDFANDRYGSDRGRFHELTGKRAVEDKNIGPLVKTVMTRCIHCTRCGMSFLYHLTSVRFANEVAGAPEFGTTGRGSDMQIGTYLERSLDTELSGNVIDLCPVGALTSKPYAFKARPWELKKVESIDVLDALGSNIQVHSRGVEVVRVIPRLNDDVNEEWISDKTRFAVDGLKNQRLTTPLVKRGDKFEAASWDEALQTIADAFPRLQAKGDEIKAIAGHFADAESMVALKDLLNRMGSENLTVDTANGQLPPAHGVDVRSNYLFNSSAHGVESATSILLVGTNPRHEAAVLNARIRKAWTSRDVSIGLVGEDFDSTFEYEKLGADLASLKKALAGKFGQTLAKAEKPMIIIGSGVAEHPEAKGFYEAISQFIGKNEKVFFQTGWNGFNTLQRVGPF